MIARLFFSFHGLVKCGLSNWLILPSDGAPDIDHTITHEVDCNYFWGVYILCNYSEWVNCVKWWNLQGGGSVIIRPTVITFNFIEKKSFKKLYLIKKRENKNIKYSKLSALFYGFDTKSTIYCILQKTIYQ